MDDRNDLVKSVSFLFSIWEISSHRNTMLAQESSGHLAGESYVPRWHCPNGIMVYRQTTSLKYSLDAPYLSHEISPFSYSQ